MQRITRPIVLAGATTMMLIAPGAAVALSGWSARVAIDPGGRLREVSCASRSFCVARDEGSRALVYNGSSWSAPVAIDAGGFDLLSVSCASASFCAAVDFGGRALTYDGQSWSAPVQIDYLQERYKRVVPDSVSCVSASFCVAVDNNGRALIYNGSSWSTAAAIDPHDNSGTSYEKVSCASTSFCLAVDDSGYAVTYNGSSWSSPAQVGISPNASTWVSCASTSLCVVGDSLGEAVTYNGSSWTAPAKIDPYMFLSNVGPTSVSCALATFCVVVDSGGSALTYNGSAWTAPAEVDTGGGLFSVSCPEASFCVAVGEHDALTYSPTIAMLTDLSETNTVFAPTGAATPLSGETSTHRKRGTTFSFTLDQIATVTVRIQRRGSGRLVQHDCKADGKRLSHKPKCTPYTTVVTLTRAGHSGRNRLAFTGRINRSALRPGHYRAVFSAIDSAGTSKARAISFTID